MKTLIILVLTALASFGFTQTDPDFAEEMRQLKRAARAQRTAAPIATVGVKASVEAKASPQALQFAFDDSGFDYYNKDEARLQLGYGEGVLTFKLSDTADGLVHSFPDIGRLNPEDHNRIYLEHQHAVSFSEKRDLLKDEQARLRERVNLTQEGGSLELIHGDAYLDSVESYYLSSLEGFGFTVEPRFKHANSSSYRLTNGTHEASILFVRKGTNIRVRLSSLS